MSRCGPRCPTVLELLSGVALRHPALLAHRAARLANADALRPLGVHRGGAANHSTRIAMTGSARDARSAGTTVASTVGTNRLAAASVQVVQSVGLTP